MRGREYARVHVRRAWVVLSSVLRVSDTHSVLFGEWPVWLSCATKGARVCVLLLLHAAG